MRLKSSALTREVPLWLSQAGLGVSYFLLVWMSVSYAARPDLFAATTQFPAWCWFLAGMLTAWVGWRRQTRKLVLATFALWLVFLFAFSDEAPGLARVPFTASMTQGKARAAGANLRVITLNCSLGNPDAAAEVEPYDPDIVLFQESPNPQEVVKLAHRLFGESAGVVTDLDSSIIARGTITPVLRERSLSGMMTRAHLILPNGIELDVISVHLEPPGARIDLWSPSAWADARLERQRRREQMSVVAGKVLALVGDGSVILGGDFNAPAGDAIFWLLKPRLHDSFPEGGQGWGNTVLNDWPVSRFDQIWLSRQFRAISVHAVKTVNSDHRMVIADLRLAK